MSENTPRENESGPERSRDVVLVPMGAWREATGDVVLQTTNLGPCLGIAVFDKSTKTGFLAHDPMPEDFYSSYAKLEQRLRDISIDHPESFESILVWLGGGSSKLSAAIAPETKEQIANNKNFVIESLVLSGIPKESINLLWSPDSAVLTPYPGAGGGIREHTPPLCQHGRTWDDTKQLSA